MCFASICMILRRRIIPLPIYPFLANAKIPQYQSKKSEIVGSPFPVEIFEDVVRFEFYIVAVYFLRINKTVLENVLTKFFLKASTIIGDRWCDFIVFFLQIRDNRHRSKSKRRHR